MHRREKKRTMRKLSKELESTCKNPWPQGEVKSQPTNRVEKKHHEISYQTSDPKAKGI